MQQIFRSQLRGRATIFVIKLFIGILIATIFIQQSMPSNIAHAQIQLQKTNVVAIASMVLDCTKGTPQARMYEIEHHLCSSSTNSRGINPFNTITSNCGTAYIYGAPAGNEVKYTVGGTSVLGNINNVVYLISYTGGSNGDNAYPGYVSEYDLSANWSDTQTLPTGYGTNIIGQLSGTVTLWYGGQCTILDPVDVINNEPIA